MNSGLLERGKPFLFPGRSFSAPLSFASALIRFAACKADDIHFLSFSFTFQ
jgi:hypothetical protein